MRGSGFGRNGRDAETAPGTPTERDEAAG
jgi:hypothetical protein